MRPGARSSDPQLADLPAGRLASWQICQVLCPRMFRTSQPVSGAAFHDREVELRRLEALVDDLRAGTGKWLAIIGPRKIGKTSLILELSRRARDIGIVIIDTQETAPLSFEFFRTYAWRSIDGILGSGLPMSLEVTAATGGDVDAVLDGSGVFARLPAGVRTGIRSLGRAKMTGELARVCLDLPERLAEGLGCKFLIAVDEFQELGSLSSQKEGDPLPLIRSVWQGHRQVSYIVSGSGRSMLEDMVSQKHSPFFQHLSLMHIESFGTEEAVALLTQESPRDHAIGEELARRAVAVLGGHPFYLQLFGEALTGHEPPYDEPAFKEALQELLFSRSGRLGLYFQLQHARAVGRSTYLAAVLDALAEGPRRLSVLARAIGASSADTIRYLERLGDNVRRRSDGGLELEDPVFGLWLRWRRPGGTVIPMTVAGNAAEQEVAGHLSRSGFELVYQSRSSRGSFDLLAVRGAAQLGIQVKGSPLPLRLSREEWNRMRADARSFGWRWVVASVSASGGVSFLDPSRARVGKEVRLGPAAVIENVVEWLDRSGST